MDLVERKASFLLTMSLCRFPVVVSLFLVIFHCILVLRYTVNRDEIGEQSKQQLFKIELLNQRNKELEVENERLRKYLQSLQFKANHRGKSTRELETKDFTWELPRPENNEIIASLGMFLKSVTILLYNDQSDDELISPNCTDSYTSYLHKLYPAATILIADKGQTVGSTFNSLFPRVKTKYFLFLDSSVELAGYSSDHSVRWLLHALINVPELDFVSGAVLNGSHLEIPCYRLLLCNWTLSQRYEYKRSVGELMICENIASSFMGKTASVRALFGSNSPPFDEKLPVLATTDFFLRAKQKGAVTGVRPEVFFTLSTRCHTQRLTGKSKEKFQALLPFAEKHKVFRFKDADSDVVDLCANDSPLLGEGICSEEIAHKVMLDKGHWAFQGTFAYPFMIENLQRGMAAVAEFLESRNIIYYIAGGVPLGALKLRAILPWDAGDVDFFVYIENQEKLQNLAEDFAASHGYMVRSVQGQVQVFVASGRVGMKMGGLMSLIPETGPVPDSAEFIKIKTNGRWIQYNKSVFREFRKYYGINYLQHRMYQSNKITHCLREKHNACLPDFRTMGGLKGTAGTFKEYFCES